MAATQKARVSMWVMTTDESRAMKEIEAGDLVDFEERLGSKRLGDLVNPDHFEPVASEPLAVTKPATVAAPKSSDVTGEQR